MKKRISTTPALGRMRACCVRRSIILSGDHRPLLRDTPSRRKNGIPHTVEKFLIGRDNCGKDAT
jgi:hypothetical protein